MGHNFERMIILSSLLGIIQLEFLSSLGRKIMLNLNFILYWKISIIFLSKPWKEDDLCYWFYLKLIFLAFETGPIDSKLSYE